MHTYIYQKDQISQKLTEIFKNNKGPLSILLNFKFNEVMKLLNEAVSEIVFKTITS